MVSCAQQAAKVLQSHPVLLRRKPAHVQVRGMAEKYFGHWRQDAIPALPPSPSEVLARPPLGLPQRLDSSATGGPALMQAFYRPGIASDDAPILDVIGCASLQALPGQQCAPSSARLTQEGQGVVLARRLKQIWVFPRTLMGDTEV